MLKVAFVGCAHIHTPGFIRMLSERKDVEVAGVWDHDAARAAKNAEATHSRVLPLETILEDASITTVIICSETNRHGELIAKTAAARKHTYAEKPLGFSAKDALVAAKQLNEAGVVFNTGYFQRGLPQNLFIRKLIQDGTLGTITRARYSNCHSGSLGKWFDTDWRWMADPSIAGCGAFGDLGTHALDILMWWFGKPAKVVSDIKVVTGHYGDCDESGEAILVFPNGVTATLAAAWVDVQDPMQSFVSGTKGYVSVIGGKVYLKCADVEGADGVTPYTALPNALPHAFNLFLDAAMGKPASLVTPDEAAQRSVVMEAIYQSNERKGWVTL